MPPAPYSAPAALRALFSDPGLARFLAALRRRAELGRPLTGSLSLPDPTAHERRALDALFGRRPTRGDTLAIDLDHLAELLRTADLAPDLRTALELLHGPVADLRAEAAAHAAAWETTLTNARANFAPHPALTPWLGDLIATGLLKRLAANNPSTAAALLADLARLQPLLPASGLPLPSLAAAALGDSHALDPGRPLATLAVRAAAARFPCNDFSDTPEGRRATWAAAGILLDELSAPVLVLNLPSAATDPTSLLLSAARAVGEPLHLSLRLLLRHPWRAPIAFANTDIFICENPAIVALAAQRHGPRCAPLVCTQGQPTAAVHTLLAALAAAGARLHARADFDWAGLGIVARLLSRHGGQPWRMDTLTYLAATPGPGLRGAPATSPWAPDLAAALQEKGHAVLEETIAETLLADLVR